MAPPPLTPLEMQAVLLSVTREIVYAAGEDWDYDGDEHKTRLADKGDAMRRQWETDIREEAEATCFCGHQRREHLGDDVYDSYCPHCQFACGECM